jgi:hypothetical protein
MRVNEIKPMKRLIAIGLSVFASSQLWAAVTFNNAATPDRQAGGSYSASHSVTAGGTNKMAFAVISWNGTATGAVTAITYGGQAMTSCGSASTSGTSGGAGLQWFYLANPPTGANTLAATVSNTPTEIYANVVSYNGVDQASPVRSLSYFASVSSQAVGVTTFSNNFLSNVDDLTISAIMDDTGIVGTNQTQDWSNTTGIMEQYGDHATSAASNVTHTWTFTATGANFLFSGFSVQAASAAGGGSTGSITTLSGTGSITTLPGTGSIATIP